ncbi:MAG: hypothetical protein H0X72_16310 [Acidobacteria bacterium]|nr:hypothetical protein [Acidobacteriota bacterium]
MRRNLEGKLDGDGIKRGEFTEAGVTIIAPIVVGAATTPKAAPQSLKTLGGLPEETTSASITTSVVKKVENAAEIVPPNAAKENAADFYRQAGWQQSRIDQHLAGIDFTKPVDVITIPKGTEVIQYQVPGKPVGNYFAPPGTTASELGMNPAGRQPRTFTTIKDMQVLRSTASPAVDTWSNAGKSFQTQGGGTQYFAPNASDLKPKL